MMNSTTEKRAIAKARLDEIVTHGRKQAASVIAQIMQTRPQDELVPAKRAVFEVDGAGVARLTTPVGKETLTDHSFGQLTDRLSPRLRAYAGTLIEGGSDWRYGLAQSIVNEHLLHSDDRMLVRHVGGQVRGVMSDTYKRIDSRPLLDAYLGALESVGAIAVSGFSTETRNSVRAILPRVIEPIAGEAMVLGLHWGNSDFGAGAYQMSAFAIRLVCLNGMVGETQMKKVHLGARLSEGMLELSDATLDLDHRTLSSATTDVVRALLSPSAVDERVSKVQAAAAQETTFEAAWSRVGKALTKSEKERAKNAYEGPDVLNLPEGPTLWRFSNALSFMANEKGVSPDRKLELQHLAGAVVGGF